MFVNINYQELLIKYIKHVVECEGVSFIPFNLEDHVRYVCPSFTQEEIEELQRLEKLVVDA